MMATITGKEHPLTQSRYAPAVLAIAHVPMNGALFPLEEMRPDDWVGKPVTLNHPTINGQFRQATDDDAIGTITGAWVEGDRLKGVIKVDASRAPRHLTDSIEREEPIDVSTGYLADEDCSGDLCLHRNIRPDHLAIVPQGACSWADGCGVRSNLKVNHVTKTRFQSSKRRYSDNRPVTPEDVRDMLDESLEPVRDMLRKTNARGEDDDQRQIIADLISDNASPFTPDDESALRMMSSASLKEMRKQYLKRTPPVSNRSDPALKAMSQSEAPLGDDAQRMVANMNASRAENERRRRRADEYCRRKREHRPVANAAVTNSDDPALQAMTANVGAVAYLQKGGK